MREKYFINYFTAAVLFFQISLHPPLRMMPATMISIAGGTTCKAVASATNTADGLVTVAVVVIQRERSAMGSPGGHVGPTTKYTLNLISQKQSTTMGKNGILLWLNAKRKVPT